ncbi:MAG: glycosyltransferase family 39 protein [Rhodomicrobium sp.]|nr:glycosyltransferase family 39 protein [Rhodomicrobium sp.]
MLKRAHAAHGAIGDDGTRWRLYSLGGVILAVALYSAIHIAARLIASGNLGEDDPLDAIMTQTLSLGYLPEQPPLYDWALWLLEQVTGLGVLHFQLLKYSLLTATCAFIFLAARRVMKGDALWAFLSVEALALIYQISWRFHEGFTHAVGAMCAVAAVFWLLLRLIERQRPLDFALLGVGIGLGVLTVTTFWVYLGALFGAAWMQPSIRSALFRPQLALSLAIAALVAGPHFIWLVGTPEGLSAILPALKSVSVQDHLVLALSGIRRAFTEPVMYLAPLIFLYPLFFPVMIGQIRRHARLRANLGPEPNLEQLILHLTLLSVGALIAAAAVFGIHRYPVHALMPLFLITSIWLTAQARNSIPSEGRIRRFVIMALSVAVFAFFARAANMYVLQPVCSICRWGIPYEGLAEEMRKRGFTEGRIAVTDRELGGNLRRFFPKAPIALAGSRAYAPPGWQDAGGAGAKIALIWLPKESDRTAAAYFRPLLPGFTESDAAKGELLTVPWGPRYWLPYENHHSQWKLLILDSAGGR